MFNSAQFNLQPSLVRSALHNAGDGYTGLLHPAVLFGPFPFNRLHGYHLALHQFSYQTFWTGSWEPGVIMFVEPFTTSTPDPTYPLDLLGMVTLWDQFTIEADYGPPTLREKYNVQKSYWTGVSRPRRNR